MSQPLKKSGTACSRPLGEAMSLQESLNIICQRGYELEVDFTKDGVSARLWETEETMGAYGYAHEANGDTLDEVVNEMMRFLNQ